MTRASSSITDYAKFMTALGYAACAVLLATTVFLQFVNVQKDATCDALGDSRALCEANCGCSWRESYGGADRGGCVVHGILDWTDPGCHWLRAFIIQGYCVSAVFALAATIGCCCLCAQDPLPRRRNDDRISP